MDLLEITKQHSDQLVKLLDDPHPGLATWHMAVARTLEQLGDLTDKAVSQAPKMPQLNSYVFQRTGNPAEFYVTLRANESEAFDDLHSTLGTSERIFFSARAAEAEAEKYRQPCWYLADVHPVKAGNVLFTRGRA